MRLNFNTMLNKFLNVVLVVLMCLLILNQCYVIELPNYLNKIFALVSVAIIFFTSITEISTQGFTFSKVLSILTLATIVSCGTLIIMNKGVSTEITYLIYCCVLLSLTQGLFQLIYSKA